MAGLNLQMGSYNAFPGTSGTNANTSPQGPVTAAEAGFGTSVGGGGLSGKATGVLSVGTLALIGLVYIWWSLPR